MFVFDWLLSNWIELFGVLTGIGSVFFLARNHATLGWLFGILNAGLFIVLMFNAHLFADLTLNGYYFVTCIYGFFVWKYGRKTKDGLAPKPISRLGVKGYVVLAAVVLIGTYLFGTFLSQMTIADYAYVDSFTTMLSFAGQYLLARKVMDNWYVWIAADVVDIPLYLTKGLFMVAGMTGVFLGLCVMGLVTWRRVERKEKQEAPAVVSDDNLELGYAR